MIRDPLLLRIRENLLVIGNGRVIISDFDLIFTNYLINKLLIK